MSKRVLVLTGVLFRNYLQKYGRIPQLDSKQESLVAGILQQKSEDNIDELISLFSYLASNMDEESPRIVFRRMSGPEDVPGTLDCLTALGAEVKMASLEEALKNDEIVQNTDAIVAPLQMQSVPQLYSRATQFEKTVFPQTYPDWISKCLTRLAMPSISPPYAYIPSMRWFNFKQVQTIQDFFEKKVETMSSHLIVKDNEGFKSGIAVRYYLDRIDNLEEMLSNYRNQELSLVIEPLFFNTTKEEKSTQIIKLHAFNRMCKTEILSYKMKWKEIEGMLSSDTVEGVDLDPMDNIPSSIPLDALDQLIAKYMPYNMMSLDFVENPIDGKWYCIDINSSCGSWGEYQETGGSSENSIFHQFADVIVHTSFEKQNKDMISSKQSIPVAPDDVTTYE